MTSTEIILLFNKSLIKQVLSNAYSSLVPILNIRDINIKNNQLSVKELATSKRFTDLTMYDLFLTNSLKILPYFFIKISKVIPKIF